MRIEEAINRSINDRLVKANQLREKLHSPSGKLSASLLGSPLQWQVLHSLGIPGKEADPFSLRKFNRGDDVEAWLVDFIPNLVSKQFFLTYRNVVGYADAIVDTGIGYDFNVGIVPMEIKSITNASFNWLKKDGDPKKHHILQATLYGLAMGTNDALLCYVASDDYRVKTFVLGVEPYKKEIDEIIDRYEKAMADWKSKGIIPVFEPIEKWQENKTYNPYPEFVGLSEKEASDLAREKLKGSK